jgi:hypothetical protein
MVSVFEYNTIDGMVLNTIPWYGMVFEYYGMVWYGI